MLGPPPLPHDIAKLRERLRHMSVLELKARGREALRNCRPEIHRIEPLSSDEMLVIEILAEWRRRLPRKLKRDVVSKGPEFLAENYCD